MTAGEGARIRAWVLTAALALAVTSLLCLVPPSEAFASGSAGPDAETSGTTVFALPRTRLAGSGSTAEFNFELPEGAAQGPDVWYVLHFHAIVSWKGDGSSESAGGVSVSTNGRNVAQVEVQRKGPMKRLFYNGVVTGPISLRPTGRTTGVEYENYLQFSGVRGGTNTVQLRYENYSGAPLDSVTVLGDSRVVRTSVHPEQLTVETPGAGVTVIENDSFEIPVVLRHKGQREEEPIVLDAKTNSPSLRFMAEPGNRIGRVGESRQESLTFRAMEPGDYTVLVRAVGGRDTAAVPVAVRVLARQDESARYGSTAAVFLGTLALAVVGNRRRRRAVPTGRRGRPLAPRRGQ